MQLIDNINNSFEKNHFTLGAFIDLSKAFDTVDHYILITKLKQYEIQGNNIRWFQNYLSNGNSTLHTIIKAHLSKK